MKKESAVSPALLKLHCLWRADDEFPVERPCCGYSSFRFSYPPSGELGRLRVRPVPVGVLTPGLRLHAASHEAVPTVRCAELQDAFCHELIDGATDDDTELAVLVVTELSATVVDVTGADLLEVIDRRRDDVI